MTTLQHSISGSVHTMCPCRAHRSPVMLGVAPSSQAVGDTLQKRSGRRCMTRALRRTRRRLLNLQGGDVWWRDVCGARRGCTFFVVLPLARLFSHLPTTSHCTCSSRRRTSFTFIDPKTRLPNDIMGGLTYGTYGATSTLAVIGLCMPPRPR